MAAEQSAPIVYVDLIEDEPMTRSEFRAHAVITRAEWPTGEFEARYQAYLDRFQPFRWHSRREGNNEILGHGERYFNEADASHAIRLQFGGDSEVWLRRDGLIAGRLRGAGAPAVFRVHREEVDGEVVRVLLEPLRGDQTVELGEGDEFITGALAADPWVKP